MENGREIVIENDKLNLNFHRNRLNIDTIQQSEDVKEDKNEITNVNDYIKETENENENENQRKEIYLRLTKMICMVLEFFLCIAFVVVENVIKEKGNNEKIFKGQYKGIATISAFFFYIFYFFCFRNIFFLCFEEKFYLVWNIMFLDFTIILFY